MISPEDAAAGTSAAESRLARYFKETFTTPEATRIGSQALIETFDDDGRWLATLVPPEQLLLELHQSCSVLSRLLIAQWTRQGETGKLVKLATALQESTHPITLEVAQMLALLAGLLGILRPDQARVWLSKAQPHLPPREGAPLIEDAESWLEIGSLLKPLPPEDRIFWNQRLRDPEEDWDWNRTEARQCLQRLKPLLPDAAQTPPLLHQVLPGCWRDVIWGTAPSTKGRFFGPFLIGSLVGAVALFLLQPAPPPTPAPTSAQSEVTIAPTPRPQPVFPQTIAAPQPQRPTVSPSPPRAQPIPPVVASPPETPPAAPTRIPAPQPVSPQPKVTMVKAEPPAPASVPLSKTPTPAPPAAEAPAASSFPPARQQALTQLAAEHPELERLHSLIRSGSWNSAAPAVQGRSSLALYGSAQHKALLRWLILAPPEDHAVRQLANKLAVRILDSDSLISALQLSHHPGSPNAQEVRECAALRLDLGASDLTPVQRQTLQALTAQP
jgi:hypothetical protein